MFERWVLAILLLKFCCTNYGFCGKVLVWPTDMSHWLNMKTILEKLEERGHEVTVLVPSKALIVDYKNSSTLNFQVIPMENNKQNVTEVMEVFEDLITNVIPKLPFWKSAIKLREFYFYVTESFKFMCEAVVYNKEVMRKLQETKYDVMVTDPVTPCGELLAELLEIPFVYTLRFSLGHTLEKYCGKLPVPPSYVPIPITGLTDKMTFLERVTNFVFSILSDFWINQYDDKTWDKLYSDILVDSNCRTLCEIVAIMMFERWALAILLLKFCCTDYGFCGKVLVWPTDMSHWLNMKTILEKLEERGHEMTVFVPSTTFLIDYKNSSKLNFQVIPMENNKQNFTEVMDEFVDLIANILPKLPFWKSAIKLREFSLYVTESFKFMCETVVYNKEVMKKLQETKYDVMVTDPVTPCGELIAELLQIPLVYTLRFSMGHTLEKYCGKLSIPPSYVPIPITGLTDKMTFLERVTNFVFSILSDFWINQYDDKTWDKLYSDVLGRPTTLCETMGKAEIWLIRTYWDFEFPRPYLPNFEFVGGLHCKPAKPLPKEMEEFVQSSGKDGIVVFSLGSMVKNLTDEKANLIASALAQVPQKVLWRYKGKIPDTLGANTRLYDWLPQNDLLGHPKTKAFITHGGTNGIYEAIYHGVPMVGVPMFADQPDNIAHMKAKGAAVDVNINTMTSADLLNALRTVINEPSYKENAMRLSRIHHDQPVKPLDRAVFWIEFVMRHKGAKHLRPAAHDLTWFQYHSLDVIAFLLTCVATALILVTKCCLFSCKKFGKTGKKKKKD